MRKPIRLTDFRYGLDLDTPEHELPDGSLRIAENMRIRNAGGVQMREGTVLVNDNERMAVRNII